MAIITIAREMASLGEDIAEKLAGLTGYRVVDRAYIEKNLLGCGFKAAEQEKYDEKKPSFWSSLSDNWSAYIQYLKLVLYEEAEAGGCIIVGRGGSVVFRKVPNHLAVRVTAPLSVRIERAMKLFSCDEQQARHLLEQSDHDRVGFSKIYFDSDWIDPRGYDITVNTAKLDADQTARAIESCMTSVLREEVETKGRSMVANLSLGQKVLTELICVKKVHLPNLTATANLGAVTLGGLSNTEAAIASAVAAAKAVPGVREVTSAIHLVQEYTVFP